MRNAILFACAVVANFAEAARPKPVSPTCLAEIRAALEYAEKEELPPTKRSAALPIQCQYHYYRELDEGLRQRINAYLETTHQSATLDQKLTEILTLLKSKSLKRASEAPIPPSQDWLYRYDYSKCPDYTGRPLMECEAYNYLHHTPANCEKIIEYAKKCKADHRCNPHFKPGKVCVNKSDFLPK